MCASVSGFNGLRNQGPCLIPPLLADAGGQQHALASAMIRLGAKEGKTLDLAWWSVRGCAVRSAHCDRSVSPSFALCLWFGTYNLFLSPERAVLKVLAACGWVGCCALASCNVGMLCVVVDDVDASTLLMEERAWQRQQHEPPQPDPDHCINRRIKSTTKLSTSSQRSFAQTTIMTAGLVRSRGVLSCPSCRLSQRTVSSEYPLPISAPKHLITRRHTSAG